MHVWVSSQKAHALLQGTTSLTTHAPPPSHSSIVQLSPSIAQLVPAGSGGPGSQTPALQVPVTHGSAWHGVADAKWQPSQHAAGGSQSSP